MILVTRLDKQQMYLNPDHIICIEETPDTVITLFNGNRYIVVDRAGTIISRVVAFRARILRRASLPKSRRHMGRPLLNRSGWIKELPDETYTDFPNEDQQTPFHSRDY